MLYLTFTFIGLIGTAMILGAYLFLNLSKIDSGGSAYLLLNAGGAMLVLISLIDKFNMAAFILELFWLIISLFGLYNLLTYNKKNE